jgi:hypothetical protein
MHFDFLLATSWSGTDVEVRTTWAEALERRGYRVALLLVGDRDPGSVEGEVTAAFNLDRLSSGDEVDLTAVEQDYEIPSIRHTTLAEKRYFGLSEPERFERAKRVASGLLRLFGENSFDRLVQARGGELHRILLHYFVRSEGGTPIWEGWSPFEGTISLHTNLDGTWDMYRTIPYGEMTQKEREDAREYVREFRERKRLIPKPGDAEDEDTWALHGRTGV